MIVATAIAAGVAAGVAWAGRAFVTWIRERNRRLEQRDRLEHESKAQCDDDAPTIPPRKRGSMHEGGRPKGARPPRK